MRNRVTPILAAMLLAACGANSSGPAPAGTATTASPSTSLRQASSSVAGSTVVDEKGPITAVSALHIPQRPPVEFGKRPPKKPMTHDNMPYFDLVAYCELTTHGKEKLRRGPLYENCIADQQVNHDVIADAIDAAKYKEADIVHCAKASRTAYEGMWYCMNRQPF